MYNSLISNKIKSPFLGIESSPKMRQKDLPILLMGMGPFMFQDFLLDYGRAVKLARKLLII